MSRVQLALNVTDIDSAIEYYSTLFDAKPAKVRPGYANFAIDDPALKLVLIENDTGGSLNHLGVEVASTDDVDNAMRRVSSDGVDIASEERQVECCYAAQDKFWTADPDGLGWEVYTVLGDSPVMSPSQDAGCCSSASPAASSSSTSTSDSDCC